MRYAILFLLLAGCGGGPSFRTLAHHAATKARPEPSCCEHRTDQQLADELMGRFGPHEYDFKAARGDGSDGQPIAVEFIGEGIHQFIHNRMVGLAVVCDVKRPEGGWPHWTDVSFVQRPGMKVGWATRHGSSGTVWWRDDGVEDGRESFGLRKQSDEDPGAIEVVFFTFRDGDDK